MNPATWIDREHWCTITRVMLLKWFSGLSGYSLVVLAAVSLWSPAAAQETASRPGDSDSQTASESPKTDAKSAPAVNLGSPRDTVRSFLVAVQDAAGDRPERIDDAVRCLDTSELKGETEEERRKLARTRATRLHAIIERIGVKLDDIPGESEPGQSQFTLPISQLEETDDSQPTPTISLVLDVETDVWRFSAGTLASLSVLEEHLAKTSEASKPSDVTVAAARRSARATMSTFLSAMHDGDIASAVQCLNPAGQDVEAWSVRSRDLVHKLKNVMDKVGLVVLAEVTDDPESQPYAWYTSETGNIVLRRVEEESENKGEWLFAPQTLSSLDALYEEFESQAIVSELRDAGVKEQLTLGMRLQKQVPKSFREYYLGLQGWQWLGFGVLLLVGSLAKRIVAALTTRMLNLWLGARRIAIDRDIQRRALRSSGSFAMVLFWWCAIEYNFLQLPAGLLAVLLPITKFVLVMAAVWFGYRLVDILGGYIASNQEIKITQFDDVLIPLLRTVLRFFVILVVILFMLDWMGKEWTTVLGALGIGGVALAFAAQDTIGNFFGSVTVLFDRPFGIGDWIMIGDIEGTVERVGFRSTRVRTFYNSVVTIPNSKMVNMHVDNYGARSYRRAKTMLSITYSTPPEKIDAFCEGIRELVRLHPYTRKDYYHVYFNKFAASSLDILLYVFFEVPDWGTELREKHRLYVDIIRLAHRLGVEFAFPTQTVWLERTGEGQAASRGLEIRPGKDDPDRIGVDEASKLYEAVYGSSPAHPAPVVIDAIPRSRREQLTQSKSDGNPQ